MKDTAENMRFSTSILSQRSLHKRVNEFKAILIARIHELVTRQNVAKKLHIWPKYFQMRSVNAFVKT